MAKELLKMTATEVGALLHEGKTTSVELTQALLAHARSLNEQVNAYISFREEEALADAQRADEEIAAGNIRSPLHGVPMGIKDNI